MEAITLVDRVFKDPSQVKTAIVDSDRRLVSSIRLDHGYNRFMASTMYMLNDEQHVQDTKEEQKQHQIFRLHGIKTSKRSELLHEYVVSVFQTEVLVMYRSVEKPVWLKKKQINKSYRKIPLQQVTKEGKKIQSLAIQSIYALGLDYGVVICGIRAGNQATVVRVIPNPKLNEEMETQFVRAVWDYSQFIHQYRQEEKKVVLGADPEFIMVNPKGNLLIASQYFPIKGKIGCDAIWLGSQRNNKPLVEIRPEPTSNPKQLIARIYRYLWQASKKVQHIPSKWLAGALPYRGFPIGGHIHFSGIKPNFKLLRALDNYLALPFVIVEDQKGIRRRPKYGFLGDFRCKDHGGFEYRTLPSWLISPTLTKGVLILAKIIALHYDQLRLEPLADVELQTSYYQGDKEALKNWFSILWHELKQFEEYDEYQKELDSFYRYVASGKTWDEKRDIRRPWRLPPFHKKRIK